MSFQIERLPGLKDRITDGRGRHFRSSGEEYALTNTGREGLPTNIGAYKEFKKSEGNVNRLIYFMRSAFPSDILSIRELSQLSSAIFCLPEYLTLRADSPLAEDAIPSSVLDATRAVAGIDQISWILSQGRSDISGKKYLSPKEIYYYANGGNLSGTNYFTTEELSCPAPEAMIEGLLSIMITKQSAEFAVQEDADWAGILEAKEITRIVDLGILLMDLKIKWKESNVSAKDETGEKIDITQEMSLIYEKINAALGYTD